MTDFSKQGNALLAAWTEGQRKVFQSQMEALDAVARSFTAWQPVQGDDPATGMAQQTRRLAEACEQQLRTW